MSEKTTDKTPATRALPDAALSAALGDLAGLNLGSHSPEEKPEARNDVAYGSAAEPKHMDLGEAARKAVEYLDKQPSTPFILSEEQPKLALVAQNDKAPGECSDSGIDVEANERARLHAVKHAAILRIERAIAMAAGDPEAIEELEALLAKVCSAKSTEAITAAVSRVGGAVTVALQKADDKMAEMNAHHNAMHKELYDQDPEYRTATDQNREAAVKSLSELDKKMEPANKLAEERGYKTKFDSSVDDLRAKLEAARKNGDELEASRLQVKYAEELAKQNDDRQKQAQAKGDHEGDKLFGGATRQAIEAGLQKAKEICRKQHEDFIAARARNLDKLVAAGVMKREDADKELKDSRELLEEQLSRGKDTKTVFAYNAVLEAQLKNELQMEKVGIKVAEINPQDQSLASALPLQSLPMQVATASDVITQKVPDARIATTKVVLD
ncbi:MAG: hypothetical protein ACOYNL_03245 [Rickettsiales bacterium]